MKKRALIIIDVQNDYFPGGNFELANVEAAGKTAGKALAAARRAALPVFFIRHESPDPAAARFAPGSNGAKIADCVAPLEGESVTTKHRVDSFADTDMEAILRASGAEELVVAGMMTHMCVDAFLRAATARGFRCLLLADACATRELEWGGRRVCAADVTTAFLAAFTGFHVGISVTNDWIDTLEGRS